MIAEAVVHINYICRNAFLFLLYIKLLYELNKSFTNESSNKTSKIIKRCVFCYFISILIYLLTEIVENTSSYLISTSSMDQYKSTLSFISHIAALIYRSGYFVQIISLGYFLKFKLQNTYNNPLLKTNNKLINFCFYFYSISLTFTNFISLSA
eukprot:360844_1